MCKVCCPNRVTLMSARRCTPSPSRPISSTVGRLEDVVPLAPPKGVCRLPSRLARYAERVAVTKMRGAVAGANSPLAWTGKVAATQASMRKRALRNDSRRLRGPSLLTCSHRFWVGGWGLNRICWVIVRSEVELDPVAAGSRTRTQRNGLVCPGSRHNRSTTRKIQGTIDAEERRARNRDHRVLV